MKTSAALWIQNRLVLIGTTQYLEKITRDLLTDVIRLMALNVSLDDIEILKNAEGFINDAITLLAKFRDLDDKCTCFESIFMTSKASDFIQCR